MAKLVIDKVEATALNPLLGRLQRVLIDQHSRGSNYQLPEFDEPFFLAMEVYRECPCGRDDLQPPFRHGASRVNISLRTNDESHVQLVDPRREMEIPPGSASQCHLLQHVLNDGVLRLQLFIHVFLTEASIEHLPAYMFPEVVAMDLDPAFTCVIKIPTTSSSPGRFLRRVNSAFAKHLRIPGSRILVIQSKN